MKVYILYQSTETDWLGERLWRGQIISVHSTKEKAEQALRKVDPDCSYEIEEFEVE